MTNEYLNTLEHLQERTVQAQEVKLVEQVRELNELKAQWRTTLWIFMGVVIGVVAIVITNIVGLRSVYPQLYCWFDNVYEKDKSKCPPKQQSGLQKCRSPVQISLAMSYPSLFNVLSGVLPIFDWMSAGAAEFLALCISVHGKSITPYMYCGNEKQIQGSSFQLNKVVNSGGTINTKAWNTECNPFVTFFPNASKLKYVKSIEDYVGSSHPNDTALGLLYSEGLVRVADFLAGSGHSGASGYSYMFHPELGEDVPTVPQNCAANAAVQGISTGTGIGMTVGMFAKTLAGTFLGPAGAAAAIVGSSLIAGGVQSVLSMNACPKPIPPTNPGPSGIPCKSATSCRSGGAGAYPCKG